LKSQKIVIFFNPLLVLAAVLAKKLTYYGEPFGDRHDDFFDAPRRAHTIAM
jgi:hypothetical protein